MATTTTTISSLFSTKAIFLRKSKQTLFSSVRPPPNLTLGTFQTRSMTQKLAAGLLGAGLALTAVGPASAAELPLLGQLSEPANALSLPTWAIHVSSVVEWVTAMALVWQYGEKSGFESWKGLAWGMVPLLGGAFCACTWHFFYNSESLEVRMVALLHGQIHVCSYSQTYCKLAQVQSMLGESENALLFVTTDHYMVLVVLQAALTVIGNATMCIAAFRIYMSLEDRPDNL
ncbi:unnamed protein product [Dovyalis caffra]|uniref:Ycf49-like protein n=1 Tax=Dovyalis caffra TaxID=77055 RepID=A0AAV1SRW7_9ROSI|nr:unnamed protein product [Dovyalis caffra]